MSDTIYETVKEAYRAYAGTVDGPLLGTPLRYAQETTHLITVPHAVGVYDVAFSVDEAVPQPLAGIPDLIAYAVIYNEQRYPIVPQNITGRPGPQRLLFNTYLTTDEKNYLQSRIPDLRIIDVDRLQTEFQIEVRFNRGEGVDVLTPTTQIQDIFINTLGN